MMLINNIYNSRFYDWLIDWLILIHMINFIILNFIMKQTKNELLPISLAWTHPCLAQLQQIFVLSHLLSIFKLCFPNKVHQFNFFATYFLSSTKGVHKNNGMVRTKLIVKWYCSFGTKISQKLHNTATYGLSVNYSKLLFYNKSTDLYTCTCLSMILTCVQPYYNYCTTLLRDVIYVSQGSMIPRDLLTFMLQDTRVSSIRFHQDWTSLV